MHTEDEGTRKQIKITCHTENKRIFFIRSPQSNADLMDIHSEYWSFISHLTKSRDLRQPPSVLHLKKYYFYENLNIFRWFIKTDAVLAFLIPVA
jgi:hypothetical protein